MMKIKNRRALSILMAFIMVVTMIPFYPLEVKAATTPTLNLGNPVRVAPATYQLPNAAFDSTGVVHAGGGYFTVAVNSGSTTLGNLASGITELTNGITIADKVSDKSTPTNRVFNFTGSVTYEDIQAAIRNMTFTQVSGETQSVTVNVTPGAPLSNGKTSVRTYDGRHFVYVARQSTMNFKDAVTIATSNNGHLVEPKVDHPEEMLAIASMFKEFKSYWQGNWFFISFIGATKTTEATNWSTSVYNETRYVSNGQITGLDNSSEIVPNGSYDHITLVMDSNNTRIGYLPVLDIHGSGVYKDPGVIVEYNPGAISDIITATKVIELPKMGGSVTIDGTATVGQTLKANVTGITYTPDTTGNVPSYQWYRDGVAISNATGSSYTLTADDLGAAITVEVIADGVHAEGSVTSASTAVVTGTDKRQLQAAVDRVTGENLKSTDYSPSSWQAFEDALTHAEQVLQNPDATQKEVDDALQALNDARDGLQADKTELEATVNEIDDFMNSGNYDENDYTSESLTPFKDALQNARDVLNNPNATQQEINEANQALREAYENLVTKDAILEKLELKVFDAQGGTEIQLEPPFDGHKYLNYQASVTESVYSAVLSFEELHPDSDVEVTFHGQPVDQWDDLQLQPGPNVITVTVDYQGKNNTYTVVIYKTDKTALRDLVHQVDDAIGTGTLKEEDYTPESWAAFEQALQAAKDVLEDLNATQQAVDAAKEALEQAQARLVKKPIVVDKTELQQKVDEIQGKKDDGSLKEAGYTPDSWNKLEEALKQAEDVLNNPAATQQEIDDAKKALEEAYTNLKPATSGGSNNGGGGTPVTNPGPSNNSGVPVPSKPNDIKTTVNGNNGSFATGSTKKDGDKEVIVVEVDNGKLSDILSKGNDQKLAIQVPGSKDVEVKGLTAADLKKLADTGSTLTIEDELLAIYPVPAKELDLDAVAKQWNGAELQDIALSISIKRASQALADSARGQAAEKGYELLVHPVDLDLTFTHDGKTVRSGQLNGYAPKYIALPEGIDPNRITTGVVVNPDGSVFHVPTVVTKIGDRYFAQINDLRSHGTYSVIWNPQDYDDVQYHWGRADVNNVAARLDLEGTGNNTFSPNRNVTRAEFAEIVVLGLGLMRQDVPQNLFPDVPASAWYRNAVALADEFEIVRGYTDGNFKGGQQITREQGFAMISRAHRMINSNAALSEGQTASVLSRYKDAADVAAWARADVAQLIAAGIIQGNGPELLSPKAQMTRAEVTALIARMLKETNLIDK